MRISHSNGKKAAVNCIIIGFSNYKNNKDKKIFDKNKFNIANNISPYLVDAPNVMIKSRNSSICDVPKMMAGNKPVDYNTLKIEPNEYTEFIKKDPLSLKYIKRIIGAEELINDKKRYCLWLKDCPQNELRKMPIAYKRVKMCREKRLKSKNTATRKLASVPTLFAEIRQPTSRYLLVPAVSSEKRDYIPMKFLDKNYIPVMGTLFIENATLYEFGVLESKIHMAWMRAVAGRLGMSYRYSKDIVYNNFIWPNPTPAQKTKIEKCAQSVLDARKLYPDSTLADLYDPNTMPPELVKAHENLDKAVKDAYGNKGFETEEEIVSSLMKLYKEAIDKEKNTEAKNEKIEKSL